MQLLWVLTVCAVCLNGESQGSLDRPVKPSLHVSHSAVQIDASLLVTCTLPAASTGEQCRLYRRGSRGSIQSFQSMQSNGAVCSSFLTGRELLGGREAGNGTEVQLLCEYTEGSRLSLLSLIERVVVWHERPANASISVSVSAVERDASLQVTCTLPAVFQREPCELYRAAREGTPLQIITSVQPNKGVCAVSVTGRELLGGGGAGNSTEARIRCAYRLGDLDPLTSDIVSVEVWDRPVKPSLHVNDSAVQIDASLQVTCTLPAASTGEQCRLYREDSSDQPIKSVQPNKGVCAASVTGRQLLGGGGSGGSTEVQLSCDYAEGNHSSYPSDSVRVNVYRPVNYLWRHILSTLVSLAILAVLIEFYFSKYQRVAKDRNSEAVETGGDDEFPETTC